MEQNQCLLEKVSSGQLSDPGKCALCLSVFQELQGNGIYDQILMDYDPALDEIYLMVTQNGRESMCLVRSYQDNLDFREIDGFRKIHPRDSP